MDTLQEKTVADFVTANIKTADVFKKHGIVFVAEEVLLFQRHVINTMQILTV